METDLNCQPRPKSYLENEAAVPEQTLYHRPKRYHKNKGMRLKKIKEVTSLTFYTPEISGLKQPIIEGGISAGFPSPADDFKEIRISLDEIWYAIKRLPSTLESAENL